MLERASRQVNVLNRLLGDMLDISRLRSGRLQIHLREEPCDLFAIVKEVVQEQRKAIPNRTMLMELPVERPVLVIADPDRIAQVLINYLSNAIKYSAGDTPVTVSLEVEEEGCRVRVSVRDEGQGLTSEQQGRVWECFYQVEDITVLSGSGIGLGLGLYISRSIIERHHGQVGVQSTPGKGSLFWFALPVYQMKPI
jgi:signal transduction histidine kinase